MTAGYPINQQSVPDKRTLDSAILQSDDLVTYVQSLLPGKRFSLLYRSSRDGWKFKDFHSKCDKKGPTLSLIRSSKGKICGGYTSVSWRSDGGFGGTYHKDNSSFLFSASHKVCYPIKRDQNAVFHHSDVGVCFSNDSGSYNLFASYAEPMNKQNAGRGKCGGPYKIPADENGNSILTGDGANTEYGYFTCKEVEVFQVFE